MSDKLQIISDIEREVTYVQMAIKRCTQSETVLIGKRQTNHTLPKSSA
jgi:TnpA family transposase